MTDKPNEEKLDGVEPPKWKLDVENRRFISSTGYPLQLKPISWIMAEQIRNNVSTKPRIPIVRVAYADQQYGEEANPNDPKYKEDLALWKSDCDLKAMVYTFANGIDIEVPESFKVQQHKYLPNADDDTILYFYLGTLIAPDDYAPLVTAIMGLTGPTEDGVRAAFAKFQRSE